MRTALTLPAGLSVLAAVLVTLTSCSAGPGATPSASRSAASPAASSAAPVDSGALESSVRTYVKAYYEPDAGAAYALLSARCRKEWSEASFQSLVDRAAQTAEQLGKAYTLRRLSVDDIHPDIAQVTYGVGEPQYDETSPWVREDGEWHNDLC
ncbi:hypothetical protein ACIRJR_18190 [Streptomyces sp. NPDC102402]|uniref:hypothetical protein n=1 Tax=Streptomyces sp. NPDC102402 TaxID=3366169 RepID=UPI0037FF87C5